ncbi:MAG: MFS transporter, partial [Shinella sp.]
LPLGGEGVQAAAAGAASAMPFAYIFIACALAMALSLVVYHLMPERPLRGRAESEIAAVVE